MFEKVNGVDVEMLTTHEAMDLLRSLASKVPASQAVVELGVFQGGSLRALGLGAQEGRGASVWGFDPYGLPGPAGRYMRLRKRYDVRNLRIARIVTAGLADIGRAFSTEAAASWDGPKVGLLYIDALHTYEAVKADTLAWLPHLAPDATIVYDDYVSPRFQGVVDAVVEMFGPTEQVAGEFAVVKAKDFLG